MATLARPTLPKAAGQSHFEEPFAALIERLLSIPPDKYRVVSCYLQLGPADRQRRTYWVELKQRIQKLQTSGATAPLDRDLRLAVERDLARLLAYVAKPANLPRARGMAIFACEALDLFAVVPLPRVRRTRLVVDDTPWIRELAAAAADFGHVIVTAVDRVHARFFDVTAAGAIELPCAPAVARRGGKFHGARGDAPGWGEHDYHDRIEEERHRHYARVVQELGRLTDQHVVRGVVIAGPLDHRAALARFLPRQLFRRLIGTTGLDPATATTAQVQAAAMEAADAYERVAVERLLASFEEALGSGWAVDGPRETLEALARGQVRVLIVRGDVAGGGYRCSRTGRLAVTAGDCHDEGDPEPVLDLVDEAVEEALRQHVEVVTLERAMGEAVDRIAAMLRFR